MIGIYKIENQINHQCYIGQSINIQRRWKDEKKAAFKESDSAYNYPLSKAFREYGIDNFNFSVLEECLIEELNDKEKYYIHKYNSFENGYNQTPGGGTVRRLPKEVIFNVINDLKTTNLYHHEIAKKNSVSIETVQGINTGRYWFSECENYPLQKQYKDQVRIYREKQKYYCQKCGKEINSYKATFCIECAQYESRKVKNRPTREELKQLIKIKSFLEIGRIYDVSDNAIRKWCKAMNLPSKKSEINLYTNEEWENI